MSPKAVDDGLTRVAGLVPLLSGPSFDPAKAVGLFDQPILMNLVLRAESVVAFVERFLLFGSCLCSARRWLGGAVEVLFVRT